MKLLKKILFVTIDASQTGGIERVLSNLLPLISKERDHRVDIFSCFGAAERSGFSYENVEVKYLNSGRADFINGSAMQRVRNYIDLLLALRKIDLSHYDKVVSVYPVISLLLLALNPGARKCIYAWEHSQRDAHSQILNVLRRYFYSCLGGVVVLNNSEKCYYDSVNKNVFVIPNPVRIQRVDYGSGIKENRIFRIISVGRLSPEKGVDRLLVILARLNTFRQDWVCNIFGNGPARANLESGIRRFGLTERVNIISNISELGVIYRNADLLAVCSRSESFGMVILEGMAAGVPVVAYDAGMGPKEIIVNEVNGFLVKDGEEHMFCISIMRVMDDAKCRAVLISNGFETAKSYEPAKIINLWREVLRSEP